MEDFSPPPYDAKAVELWIHEQMGHKQPPNYIADELLKNWEKNQLLPSAKQVVGRFCAFNSFYLALIRALKRDLVENIPLPWNLLMRLLRVAKVLTTDESKELLDALLVGATRDGNLHTLAAEALKTNNKDPRWPKILESELNDRFKDAENKRKKYFEEFEIFKREGMKNEAKENLQKILALFPHDDKAKKNYIVQSQNDLDASLISIRKEHDRRHHDRREKEELPHWPELKEAVEKNRAELDLDSAYNFSIGLHQMGFHDLALVTLRGHSRD